MRKTKKNKKKSAGRFIVFLVLLLLLAGLLAVKYFTNQPDTAPAAPSQTDNIEEHLESGVIIRPVQPEQPDPNSQPAPAASESPAQQPAQETQGAVILENEGDLEIIIPEGMDSDGF